MATKTAPQAQTTTTERPASNGTTDEQRGKSVVQAWLDAPITFRPFEKETEITLTPRRVKLFFCKPTKSGQVCTDEQAMKFCQLCKSRGLDPWEGDAFIVGYDAKDGTAEFSLITAHQAFLKRAEACVAFDGMESGVIVRRVLADKSAVTVEYQGDYTEPGDVLVGGWARVYRKDRTHPTYRRLNVQTFDKGFSRWNADKAGMIVKCAEADALRSTFPNKVGGLILQEEIVPAEVERDPLKDRLSASVPTNGSAADAVRKHYEASAPQEETDEAGPIPPLPTDGTLPGFAGAPDAAKV